MEENFENKEPGMNEPEPGKPHKLESAYSPLGAAFLGLIAVFILYQFGGAVLTLAIFGLDFEKADVNALRMLTVGGQILFILLPALIFAKLVYHDVTSALRVKLPNGREVVVFITGLILLIPLLQSFIYVQNFVFTKLAENISFFDTIRKFLDELDKLVESAYGNLLEAHSFFEGSFIVFVVAAIPALCEETFFRGFVQKSLEQRLKPYWAIIITSLFFGLYHFNPYGLISLMALGAYFGFAAYTSSSIFIPMILHFINNFFAVITFLLIGDKDLINSNVTQNENIFPYLISFIVLSVIFSFFIMYIHRNYNKIKGDRDDMPQV